MPSSLDQVPQIAEVLVGTFTHALDQKRRITIPSRWRTAIGDRGELYVLPDFEKTCLNIYPAREIAVKIHKLRQLSMTDARAMEFTSILGGSSSVINLDPQGRIRVDDWLLDFAQVTDQVVLVGSFDRFQLWSPVHQPAAKRVDQTRLREAGQYVDF